MVYEGGDSRHEMVGDLLELAACNKCCGDFRWLSADAVGNVKMQKKCQREKLVAEVTSIPRPSYS